MDGKKKLKLSSPQQPGFYFSFEEKIGFKRFSEFKYIGQ